MVGTILVTMRIEENFNPRPYPSNPSNNFGNSYNNSYGNYNKMPYDFESNIKNLFLRKRILML